jgi:hypothetical protein
LKPGDIGYGHLHAWSAVLDFLCQPGYAPYFLLRDPRDVAVSHVHYVTDMQPNHIHHAYYRDELHSFDERLQVSILGKPDSDLDFPNIYERFAPYLGWLERPQVLVLRFEDFIKYPRETIGRTLDHATGRGFPLRKSQAEAIRVLGEHLNPTRSPTFRSGKAGGWREAFSPENKRLFKEVAGEMLLTLGYERDLDW